MLPTGIVSARPDSIPGFNQCAGRLVLAGLGCPCGTRKTVVCGRTFARHYAGRRVAKAVRTTSQTKAGTAIPDITEYGGMRRHDNVDGDVCNCS